LRRKLANHLFWLVGYSGHLAQGNVAAARSCFRQALALWPTNVGYWKTGLWRGVLVRPPLRPPPGGNHEAEHSPLRRNV
jgi:hypothetical protein